MATRNALPVLALLVACLGSTASSALADTKQEPEQPTRSDGCHPSYSGCLDVNASDYDCVGGSGNGPKYTGRVRVIGPDVFRLDDDRDGWGCE